MSRITGIIQQTKNRFLNLFELETVNRVGTPGKYFVASRAEKTEDLKIMTKKNRADGVAMYVLCGPEHDKVLLIRQWRWPLGAYVYEFPAGLVDGDESFREAAVREVWEETGLRLEVVDADPMFEEPRFMTDGMTDESCAMVYGYADDVLAEQHLEDSEEIEVLIADRDEVRRILKEEYVACNCALQLMHFLADEEPFAFLKKD